MTLVASLKIEPADLRFQENPVCRLTLTNRGDEALRFPDPRFSETLTRFRLVNVRTGAETWIRKPRKSTLRERQIDLAPGRTIQWHFLLSSEIPVPAPGEYAVSAVCDWRVDAKPAESEAVRFRVRPTTPSHLCLDTHQGLVAYGAWLDLGGDTPTIVRSRFDLVEGGGVREVLPIAKAAFGVRPVLSLPPNRRGRERHWIAWKDGGALHFTHVSRELGVAGVGRAEIAGDDWEIVPPLFSEPVADTRVRPEGAALLRVGGRLQVLRLAPGAATFAAAENLAGSRPVWSQSYPNGSATLIGASGSGPSLMLVPWSSKLVGSPRTLVSWRGRFVAAGATLCLDDVIRGATLLEIEKEKRSRHDLIRWEIEAKGDYREETPIDIDWPESAPISDAVLRVSGRGVVAGILRDGIGKRFHLAGGRAAQLSAPLAVSSSLVEPAFLNGLRPVLICAAEERGLRVLLPDGKPLPPRPY